MLTRLQPRISEVSHDLLVGLVDLCVRVRVCRSAVFGGSGSGSCDNLAGQHVLGARSSQSKAKTRRWGVKRKGQIHKWTR